MSSRPWLAFGFFAALLTLAVVWHRAPRAGEAATPDDSSERRESPAPTAPVTAGDRRLLVQGPSASQHESARSEREPSATAAVAPQSHTIFGVVLPPEGQNEFKRKPTVRTCDRLGKAMIVECAIDGSYSISGLAPGPHWLSASEREGGAAHAYVEIDPTADSTKVDFLLERPREVLVRAIDLHGEPLTSKELVAIASHTAPGEWFEEATGGQNNLVGCGQFWHRSQLTRRPSEEYLGKLVVHASSPVWISLTRWQRVLARQYIDVATTEVEFVIDADSPLLDPSSIRGRFVDAVTLEPTGDRRVMLQSGGATMMAAIDSDGSFLLEGCFPGWNCVRSLASGYERCEVRVLVEPGGVHDVGTIPLERGVSVEGFVRDASGSGVAAKLHYEVLDPPSWTAPWTGSTWAAQSETDGSFRIEGLSRRVYRLTVQSSANEWGASRRVVDLRNGSASGVELRVEKGVALVVWPSIADWTSVSFSVRDSAGLELVSSRFWGPEPRRILLAPGRYELECRVGDELPTRRAIEIGGEPLPLTLP